MDSQHPLSNNPDTTQPFRGDFAFHAANTEQFNYLAPDSESSFNHSWDAGRYTPDGQDPNNGFSSAPQHWGHGLLQSPNYAAPNYNAIQRPYDQTFSLRPGSLDATPNYTSHSQQNPQTSTFDPRSNIYNQVPQNGTPNFSYADQRVYPIPNVQSQTISPQALQHYPTANTQATLHNPRQPPSVTAASGLGARGGGIVPPAPIDGQGWRLIASKVPASSARRGLLVRDAAELSNNAGAKKFQGSSFLSSSSVEVVATKASLPKYNKRRSKNDVQRLLLQEKGTGPWNLAREPVRKKLKRTNVSVSNARPTPSSASPAGTPTAESVSSIESSSGSESEEDSEYSSGSDNDSQIDEKSPLPKSRPTDPGKATEYDITKAVWAKRSVVLSGAVIRTALGECWDIFKGIRDKWKAEMASLQQAEEKKDKAKTSQCKTRVEGQRRLLETCIRLTLKHGHNDIIERLGENPTMSIVLSSFLIDRTKENEYAGSFITSILELMIRWLKVEQKTLEGTKLDKLLPKLVKKGDEKVKTLAQKVLDNFGMVPNKQIPDGKIQQPQTTRDSTTANEINSGLKRPRSSEPTSVPPSKKQTGSDNVITTSTKPVPKPISALEKRRQQAAKADPKAGAKATSSAVTEKVKTNHIAAKPSAFFSSLQSASKKSSGNKTTTPLGKGKDGKDVTASDTKGAPTAGSAASKPAFSFAETMANLNRQKSDAPLKSEETRPPETAEEKRKRLRKEQRRKLRVSFKADDELVEVRTFVHDPEEELGHDDSMVRDVGDSRGEGQMLKMHKDLDLDEEEEDYEPTEALPAVWHEPSLIDFNVVDDTQRQQAYVTRGGLLEVRSPERILQEQRESSRLLVVYTSPSDIPPSPSEPNEQPVEGPTTEVAFGQPGEGTKSREAQYYASRTPQATSLFGSMPGQAPTPDISAILKIINSQQQPQQIQPQQPQPPPVQAQPNGLEAIFAQFANSNTQQPPQAQMQPSIQPPPPPPGFDIHSALAVMNVANPAQPAYVQHPPNQQPNLNAILAGFGQQPAGPMQSYGYSTAYQPDNDRKRQADAEDQSSADYGYREGKRQKGEEKPNAAKDNHYFNYPIHPSHYISTEDAAVDSYQNFLFSILRFHTLTRRFPTQITLISHDFKKRRFLELHVPAIRWPKQSITFVGIDPPDYVVRREVLDKGEAQRGYGAFEGDLYGVGELLGGKRVARGWRWGQGRELWGRSMGDSVLELLEWSGGKSGQEIFPGRLPWDHAVDGND